MEYYGDVYRPPSEAYSLLLQITYGCSHNKCTFCSMYKDKQFKVRPVEDVLNDIRTYPVFGKPMVRRAFLMDGDPMCIGIEHLVTILKELQKNFPNLERVGAYSTSKDIIRKSVDELKLLKENKLDIMYVGVESGSDKILRMVKKNSFAKDIIEAAPKLKEAGIKLSTMILSGLGGRDMYEEHAIESARVISAAKPDYLSLLTLMSRNGTELSRQVDAGEFHLVTPIELLRETRLFVENLELENTVFRANHASNLINLRGVLNKDKEDILRGLYSIRDEDIEHAVFSQIY